MNEMATFLLVGALGQLTKVLSCITIVHVHVCLCCHYIYYLLNLLFQSDYVVCKYSIDTWRFPSNFV